METSPSIAALAASLSKAQSSIEGAVKGKVNPAFKSKYADLSSVWEACREALTDNGLSVVQSPGPVADGRMELTTMLLHASGEWMRGTLTIPLGKVDAQAYGSATTYARRYALAAFVGVSPEDDDGNAASQHRAPPPADPATTLANRADGFVARINAAEDGPALEKTWGLGAKLCAELDLKDPDKLAVITALYETRRDELTTNPFTKDA